MIVKVSADIKCPTCKTFIKEGRLDSRNNNLHCPKCGFIIVGTYNSIPTPREGFKFITNDYTDGHEVILPGAFTNGELRGVSHDVKPLPAKWVWVKGSHLEEEHWFNKKANPRTPSLFTHGYILGDIEIDGVSIEVINLSNKLWDKYHKGDL